MMDLDEDAKRLLALTREARTPGAADKVRVERLLAGAMLLGSTSARAASDSVAPSKMAGGTLASKWAGVALLALAGGAGYLGWRASHAARNTAPATVSATRMDARPVEPVAVADLPGTTGGATTQRGEIAAATPRAVAAPATALTRTAAARGSLPEELDLLHEAQAKWRAGNASAALALLSEHRQRFPRSQLAPERDALTVLSLCVTGRTADAKKLARRFLLTAKHSPLRTSVEESCGGK